MSGNFSREKIFHFKQFDVVNDRSAMKVGTDSVLLGAWATPRVASPMEILDVGCGTGILSLMSAQRFPTAEITAVEIDQDAANEASDNFLSSVWSDRLHVVNTDFLQWQTERKYDLIVCNPPYFSTGERSNDSKRATARHTDTLSLESLTRRVAKLLKPDGVFALIVPEQSLEEAIYHSALCSMNPHRVCHISPNPGKKPIRCMAEFGFPIFSIEETTLQIRGSGQNDFTTEYRELTSPFYMNF